MIGELFGYKLMQHGLNVEQLQDLQETFSHNLGGDAVEEIMREFDYIWDIEVCKEWFCKRRPEQNDKFIELMIRMLNG
ncbi:hypothetical protein CCP1ISM_40010 [Azospirillaceae bacterium]